MRDRVSVLLLVPLLLAAVASPANGASDNRYASGITQYFTLNYNDEWCSNDGGNWKFQIYQVSYRWYRNNTTDRFVNDAKFHTGELGTDCSRRSFRFYYEKGPFTPCWGTSCPSGSTSPNWTMTYNYWPSWGYLGSPFLDPGPQIGGTLQSVFKSRNGTVLATPCSRVILEGVFTCGW